MTSQLQSFGKILPIAIATVLSFPVTAIAQTERKPSNPPVSINPPTVSLERVGKRVSPGVYEVNPEFIKGKLLLLPSTNTNIVVCIGRWDPPVCRGIFIGNSTKAVER